MSVMNYGYITSHSCFFCRQQFAIWFMLNDTSGPMLYLCKSCWDKIADIRKSYERENKD